MGKRWSKLQIRLYNLMEPAVDFQIHCALYEMNGLGPHAERRPRYFISIDKEIVFDYPKDVGMDKKRAYPWDKGVSKISDLIEEYIQRPKEMLFDDFPNDEWGIIDIFLACDRRVGKKGLQNLENRTTNKKVWKIIEKRRNI